MDYFIDNLVEVINPDQIVECWLINHIGYNYKEAFHKKNMDDILKKVLAKELTIGIYKLNTIEGIKYCIVVFEEGEGSNMIYTNIPVLKYNKEESESNTKSLHKDAFLRLDSLKEFISANINSSAVNANDVPSTISILKENLDRLLISYSNNCKYIIDTIKDILISSSYIKKLDSSYIVDILYDYKEIALYGIEGFIMKNNTTYISLEIWYQDHTKDLVQMPIKEYFSKFDKDTQILNNHIYLAIVDKHNKKIGDASTIHFTGLECKRKTISEWTKI